MCRTREEKPGLSEVEGFVVEKSNSRGTRDLILLIAAFAAVYVVWGSTYLAIKYAIDTIPGFIMAGFRFLVAGTILYVWARFSPRYQRPTLIHWRTSVIVGGLLLALGNGGVVLAESYISSSLAALLVASNPFWIVILSWLFMKSGRPRFRVALGLLIGFAGVSLLIFGKGDSTAGASTVPLIGIVLIGVATLGWAIGSLYGSKAETAKPNILAAGMQMLSGGVILMLLSLITGEWSKFEISAVSTNSLIALVYLIVFGAIVAYTAYNWLLKNASPSTVSTYAYVNPAIAVLLGWGIAGETLTGPMLIGAAVIVGSIVLITTQKGKKLKTENKPEPIVDRSAVVTGEIPISST
jgi:drug/metabolite transporter (DMT)-like permease